MLLPSACELGPKPKEITLSEFAQYTHAHTHFMYRAFPNPFFSLWFMSDSAYRAAAPERKKRFKELMEDWLRRVEKVTDERDARLGR